MRSYLKQIELAVHHAQKSVENAESDGLEFSEDAQIVFRHPSFQAAVDRDSEKEEFSKEQKQIIYTLMDTYYNDLQDVQLEITL